MFTLHQSVAIGFPTGDLAGEGAAQLPTPRLLLQIRQIELRHGTQQTNMHRSHLADIDCVQHHPRDLDRCGRASNHGDRCSAGRSRSDLRSRTPADCRKSTGRKSRRAWIQSSFLCEPGRSLFLVSRLPPCARCKHFLVSPITVLYLSKKSTSHLVPAWHYHRATTKTSRGRVIKAAR